MKKVSKMKSKNPWIEHLLKEKAKHPNKRYKDIMVLAKKSYKPKHK